MRLGVCELSTRMVAGSEQWKSFVSKVRRAEPEILLLNEMPFGPWIAAGNRPDPVRVEGSLRVHEEGVGALGDLGVPVVLGTRAVRLSGSLVNEAFVWSRSAGLRGVHTKQYFPDEEGYYEDRWFQAGERHFRAADAGGMRVGFLICTEIMFNEHARRYGRQGVHLIAVPRAVGKGSLARWLVAMRMAAIVSGCYVASSNRAGTDASGQVFGGCGWIVGPDGELLAQTSEAAPVACCEIDLEVAIRAQSEYPCYVPELE